MSEDGRAPRRRTQAERVDASGRALLEAAAELISERGWASTTAAEIGRRAGYSRAMVAARFGGKDALLDTLLEREYESRLVAAAPEGLPGFERALLPLVRLARLHREEPEFLASMFVLNFEAANRTTSLRPRMAGWMERIVAFVADGLRAARLDGSLRRDVDLDALLAEIVSRGVGAAYLWVMLPDRFDFAAEVDRLRADVLARFGVTAGSEAPTDRRVAPGGAP